MKNNTQHLGQNISITILIYSTMGVWIGYMEPKAKVYFAEQSNRCLNFWALLLKIFPLLIYYMLENNTKLFLLNSKTVSLRLHNERCLTRDLDQKLEEEDKDPDEGNQRRQIKQKLGYRNAGDMLEVVD